MKSKVFLIIIPLVFILITAPLIDYTFGNASESMLYKALAESGAEMVSTEITFSGITESFVMDIDRNSFIAEVTEALGHNLPVMPEVIQNGSFNGLNIHNSKGSNISYNLKLLQSKEKEEQGKSYVTLYWVDSSSAPSFMEIKSKAAEVFKKFGIKPAINMCFTGRYEGKLEITRIDELCDGIFKRTSARKVTGMRDNNLISVSAWSRAIKESVSVNGKNVNIGFAARYNSYEEKTYIWLATPIITTEY